MRALENSCSFLTNERPAEGAQELFFFFFFQGTILKKCFWCSFIHLYKIYIEYILSSKYGKRPRNVHLQIRKLGLNCGIGRILNSFHAISPNS